MQEVSARKPLWQEKGSFGWQNLAEDQGWGNSPPYKGPRSRSVGQSANFIERTSRASFEEQGERPYIAFRSWADRDASFVGGKSVETP